MQFYCGFTPGLGRIYSFTAVSPRGWEEYAVLLRFYPGAGKNMQFHCGKGPNEYVVLLRKMPKAQGLNENTLGPNECAGVLR